MDLPRSSSKLESALLAILTKNPHLRYRTFSAKASTNEKEDPWNSVSSHGTQKHSPLFLGLNDRLSSV